VDIIQRKNANNNTTNTNITNNKLSQTKDSDKNNSLMNEASVFNTMSEISLKNSLEVSYPSLSPSPYTTKHRISEGENNSINNMEHHIDIALKNIEKNVENKARLEAANIDKFRGKMKFSVSISIIFLIIFIFYFLS
jgi:hypothetical protein